MTSAVRRFRYELLLGILLLGVIVLPALDLARRTRQGLAAVVLTLLVAAALNAVSAGRRLKAVLIVLAVIALVTTWMRLGEGGGWLAYLHFATAALFFVLIAARLLRDVLAPGRITTPRIMAALCIYFTLGFAWGELYLILLTWDPAAIRGIGALDSHTVQYFSLVTLTTLGYGDIVPVHPVARSLAAIEAATGVIYLGTLVARLVALQIIDAKVSDDDDEPPQTVTS